MPRRSQQPKSPNPLQTNTNSTKSNNFTKNRGILETMSQGPLDFFRCVVDRIGDEVMVIDRRARIVFVNKAAARGLGIAPQNILGRSLLDFLDGSLSMGQWRQVYFPKIKQGKGPLTYIVKQKTGTGKIRSIDMTVSYLSYKSEDYALAVGRDITDKLAFQQRLKESEDRYRLLSDQAADGIVVVDLSGHIVYANGAAGALLKSPVSKIIGSHFERYVEQSSLAKSRKYFQTLSKGQPMTLGEIDVKDAKGQRVPVEFTSTPILRNEKIFQIHTILRNISEKKGMEHLLRETEKMEAFQHFITGTTYEIQQPLKGLLEFSQNLIDRYKDRDFEYIGYKEYKDIIRTLQIMNDQVKYCCDTTDRLNNLNRRKANLHSLHCNVNHVIRDAVHLLKHSIEVSGIKTRLQLNPQLPQAVINALDLRQVINNILTNAIQALAGGGGTIKVRTSFSKQHKMIRVDCWDDGVGIPKELLPKVFDPFFTTKSRGLEKNSGLGLYVVYSILKAYKGSVTIQSEPRKGAHVTVLIPAYSTSAESAS